MNQTCLHGIVSGTSNDKPLDLPMFLASFFFCSHGKVKPYKEIAYALSLLAQLQRACHLLQFFISCTYARSVPLCSRLLPRSYHHFEVAMLSFFFLIAPILFSLIPPAISSPRPPHRVVPPASPLLLYVGLTFSALLPPFLCKPLVLLHFPITPNLKLLPVGPVLPHSRPVRDLVVRSSAF